MWTTYLIYNLVLFIGGGLVFLSQYAQVTGIKKLLYLISFLFVWLVSALRYNVGTDYPNYIYIFDNLYLYEFGVLEPIYYLLNQVIVLLGINKQWLFITTSFISTFFIYKTANYYNQKGWFILFYLLFLYLASLSIVRQLTAVSIIVYGVHHLLNYNNKKFILSILFAAGFHYSAFFLAPMLLLTKIRLSWIGGIILFIGVIILIRQVNIIQGIFSNSFFENSKYAVYAINEYNRESELGSGLGVLIQILPAIILVLFSFSIQKLPNYSLVILTSIAFVASMLLTLDVYIFNRLMVVLSIYYMFVAVYIAESNMSHKYILLVIISLGGVAMFEKTISIALFELNSGLGISPYQSVLQFIW